MVRQKVRFLIVQFDGTSIRADDRYSVGTHKKIMDAILDSCQLNFGAMVSVSSLTLFLESFLLDE